MSETRRNPDGEEPSVLESEFEPPAERSDFPDFRGPTAPLEGHETVDHFGLIYETSAERWAAIVPFVRQGIERGERCMYIHADNSRDEVIEALRSGGVDVDPALESGQLSLHTAEETYLDGGGFDVDEGRGLLERAMAEAQAEYEGFRVTAEETWLVGDEDVQEAFMSCEAHVNDLVDGENSMALCQYDRTRLPATVIRDVIRTHPYIIYDGTVCQNDFYTPPEEYFGPDRPARDNERKLRTLVDRTEAQATLETEEWAQRRLYAIAADPHRSFDEKIDDLLAFGREVFDVEVGGIARVDPATDYYRIEALDGTHEQLEEGTELSLSEAYCRKVIENRPVDTVPEPTELSTVTGGVPESSADAADATQVYLGTCIPIEGDHDRTFFFASSDPTDGAFSEKERTFLRLMGQWMKYELERRRHERLLRDLYETIADPEASVTEKVEGLLELGSDRFGLEIGYFTQTDDDDMFEIVAAVGDHDEIRSGVRDSLCDTYCEKLLASPGPISVTDAAEVGWTDDRAYERFGLDAYFATTVHAGGEEYGTLCFASTEARERSYSDAERTFLDLMGEWLSYELEQRRRERYLRESYEITSDPERSFEEKLQSLFDLGCEQFGLELGAMATVDSEADRFEVEYVSDDHDHFEPGLELPLSETYCDTVVDCGGIVSVTDPIEYGYDDLYVHREFGTKAYLGTYIEVEGDANRTFFFVSEESRDAGFTDDERTFQRLLGQWVKYELERQRRERDLRRSYEITADSDLSFDEKLERLLELGRERFGLEMGGLNHLPSWDGAFRLEKGVGLDVAPDEELWTDPGTGCFCRRTIASDEPVDTTDARESGWTRDEIYREFGLTSYLGTKVSTGTSPYGTLWFGSTEPRDRPFTDDERTFIELIGQWIGYEIERREHRQSQEELYEITADGDLSFDEKTERLLDLARDRFDLDMGFLLEKEGDAFRVVKTRGTDLEEGVARVSANPGNYCKQTITMEEPLGVEDVAAAGWDDDPLYQEYDMGCYLGTKVTDGDGVYGSVCFADSADQDRTFTDADYAFLDLIGQWLSYELERDERERRLERSNERLEESNKRLEQFAYAASHDLQEPLRMVSSYLQLLESRYGDRLDAEGEEFLEFAVDGSERMREMIDALLQYSRVETQGEPLEPVALEDVFECVREDLRMQIEEADAEITADALPRVEGDASQLRQVFQNLLSNAITYSGDEPPRIDVRAERRGQKRVIAVEDDGIGIDPEEQDRIFDIFDRLHSREEYDGTGIGLALCERIVERHGGDIWVESEPGEGSTFFVALRPPAEDDP